MPRASIETAKTVIASLLNEQERDRESLQRLFDHSEKMIAHLQAMRDEEEVRIDAEANERKQAMRRIFTQLTTVEEERRERLQLHIADLAGQKLMNDTVSNTNVQQRITLAMSRKG